MMDRVPRRSLVTRKLSVSAALVLVLLLDTAPRTALGQEALESPLLLAGVSSGLPLVQPNDNRRAAGSLRDGTRAIALEVSRADWRVEGPDGPGLRVAAIGEVDVAPMIPAPLLRVETGGRLEVTVRNRLPAPVTVFGLHPRPAAAADSFVVAPGETKVVRFAAGASCRAGDVRTPRRLRHRAGPEPRPALGRDEVRDADRSVAALPRRRHGFRCFLRLSRPDRVAKCAARSPSESTG